MQRGEQIRHAEEKQIANKFEEYEARICEMEAQHYEELKRRVTLTQSDEKTIKTSPVELEKNLIMRQKKNTFKALSGKEEIASRRRKSGSYSRHRSASHTKQATVHSAT